jgi:ABC-type dipeptide/oligopeptide/nickel transport system permease subunit
MALLDQRGWRRFRAHRGGMVGLAIVVLVTLLSVFAPWIAPNNPITPYGAAALNAQGLPTGPTRRFPLGADSLGRCELSRLLYGGRVSLTVALVSTAIVLVVGTLVGVLAGYFSGWVDTVLMRTVDVLLSFPFLLVVMAINRAIERPGLWVLFLVLGLLSWTGFSRQVRTRVLQLRALEYVTAARALGAGSPRIIAKHIVPNLVSLLVVMATTLVAEMIVVESVLSYLGVGVVAPTPSWGAMLQDAEPLMRMQPRLTAVPGLAIFFTVVGFNLLGEGLRDAFDPRS